MCVCGCLGTFEADVLEGVACEFFFHSVWYRNEVLVKEKGFKAPTTLKTGTTIAGVVFKGGVVLGADTRATEGPIVADKFCEKIHFLADNIRCCGAGTAADTEFTTGEASFQRARFSHCVSS